MKLLKPLIRSIMIFFSVVGVLVCIFALCMAAVWLHENIAFLERFDPVIIASVTTLAVASLSLGFFLPDDEE